MLDKVLALFDIKLVIGGKARGADTIGENWAKKRKLKFKGFPANWNKHGKRAGPIRNQQMLDEGKPTHAVAFWTGKRDNIGGTADMTRRLTAAKIEIWHIEG